jgi:amidohydrolase
VTLQKLIELRHELHRHPELSGKELRTATTLYSFLSALKPDSLTGSVGGNGLAAVFSGKTFGKTVLLRCEMDALPVAEDTELPYRSLNQGVSHKCGHDGHMAILCGVASSLSDSRPATGTVVLLFQPSEETGTGAESTIRDLQQSPDMCFALHNLPGFPMASVIVKPGTFAGASKGLVLKLTGCSSHAAEPQKGISPAKAVAALIRYFESIQGNREGVYATVVYVNMGRSAFGTSPGNADILVTLRAPTDIELSSLSDSVVKQIQIIAHRQGLKSSVTWSESFSATVNSDLPAAVVKQSAEYLRLKCVDPENPFPWSEDFGQFTGRYSGALFGLGAGLNAAALHSPDYDFPDELIPTGIKLYTRILERALES